jgi:hypothetical protein
MYPVFASAVAAAVAAPAAAHSPYPLVFERRCDVVAPVFQVHADRVKPLVPAGFDVQVRAGLAEVQVGAVSCESVVIDGNDIGRTRWVSFRVNLGSNPKGDSDALGEFNAYQFFMASDNKRFISFFRDHGADPAAMVYVKDLTFENFGETTGTVTITAPSPTPSPFTLEFPAAERQLGPVQLVGQIWGTGPGRTGWWQVGPNDEVNGMMLGPAAGTLRIDDPTSVMGRVFCESSMPFADVYAIFEESHYPFTQDGKSVSRTSEPPPC